MMKKQTGLKIFAAVAAIVLVSGCGVISSDPLAAGKQAFDNNAYGEARIHLKNALQEDPQSAEANLLFARTMLAMGDGLTAQNALRKVSEGRLIDAGEYRNLEAEALLLQGKAKQAETVLGADIAQWDAQAFMLATRAALDLDDFGKAQSVLENGLKQHKDSAELLALDAALLLEQGRLTAAKQSAAAALASEDDNLSALLISGQLAQLTDSAEAAQKHFDKALNEHPDSLIPLISLAAIQADQGKYEKALDLLDRADNLYTVQPISAFLRARIFYEQDEIQIAYNILQDAGTALSSHPPSLLLAGEIALGRKNYNQAEERLNRFLKFMPGHTKGTVMLADALEQSGDVAGAARVLRDIIGRADIDPGILRYASSVYRKAGLNEDADRLANRADVPNDEKLGEMAVEASRLIGEGKNAEALILYEKAIAGGLGKNALVRNNAAYAALELKQFDKALLHARAAHALTPDDPSVRDTLGWALLRSGEDRAGALGHLRFAARNRPADIEIRWHFAQALIANGRGKEAKAELDFIKPFVTGAQRAELDKITAAL